MRLQTNKCFLSLCEFYLRCTPVTSNATSSMLHLYLYPRLLIWQSLDRSVLKLRPLAVHLKFSWSNTTKHQIQFYKSPVSILTSSAALGVRKYNNGPAPGKNPPRGSSAYILASNEWPLSLISSCFRGITSPEATLSCHSTRSTPKKNYFRIQSSKK